MSHNLSTLEHLCYSTVRIENTTITGGKVTGTGFFYKFFSDSGKPFPAIITNRHVVENAKFITVILNEATREGNLIKNEYLTLQFGNNHWILHPDPNIDLCIIEISSVLEGLQMTGKNAFMCFLDQSYLPSEQDLNKLDAVEDILMIGYPNGIWDAHNNLPIVRKGITATHPNINYNGKKEFIIDAACFPGSSGSPILLYDNQRQFIKINGVDYKRRLHLLGILYAGPQYNVKGEIIVKNVPTVQQPIAISAIPNNLGCIIKSELILDFEQVLKKQYAYLNR